VPGARSAAVATQVAETREEAAQGYEQAQDADGLSSCDSDGFDCEPYSGCSREEERPRKMRRRFRATRHAIEFQGTDPSDCDATTGGLKSPGHYEPETESRLESPSEALHYHSDASSLATVPEDSESAILLQESKGIEEAGFDVSCNAAPSPSGSGLDAAVGVEESCWPLESGPGLWEEQDEWGFLGVAFDSATEVT
jgi:hypothetical protein